MKGFWFVLVPCFGLWLGMFWEAGHLVEKQPKYPVFAFGWTVGWTVGWTNYGIIQGCKWGLNDKKCMVLAVFWLESTPILTELFDKICI